jgi:hypothetical protein
MEPVMSNTLDATLTLPDGTMLHLGRFTARYAAIAGNWHRAWLGLDEPMEEVPDERWALGRSWSVFSLKASRRVRAMPPSQRKGKPMKQQMGHYVHD